MHSLQQRWLQATLRFWHYFRPCVPTFSITNFSLNFSLERYPVLDDAAEWRARDGSGARKILQSCPRPVQARPVQARPAAQMQSCYHLALSLYFLVVSGWSLRTEICRRLKGLAASR